MAVESPLFQSAMELLGHAISHFNGREELDRKLVILHLANAIELVLKDVLLDAAESIYKNPKETITIIGCIQKLKEKEIPIPFLNKIELLIDERNALQHRFGSPNDLTAIFYMNIATEFFKHVLQQHYGLEFDEVLEQFTDETALVAFRMREPSNESELENLMKLASVHPLGALLSAMTYLERKIIEFGTAIGLEERELMRFPGTMSYRILRRYGVEVPNDLARELDDIRRLRNQAAHGRQDPSQDDVYRAVKAIGKFEDFLESLDLDEVRAKVEIVLQEQEIERRARREAMLAERQNSLVNESSSGQEAAPRLPGAAG